MGSERFKGQNVLITGGSSGIGLATAVEFARLGAHLFLLARHEGRLQAARQHILDRVGPGVPVHLFQADVGEREQIETVITTVGQQHGGLHTLVNNAGILLPGRIEDNTVDRLEYIMRVNYFSVLYAIKAAWPYLIAANQGHIGLVSSVAGYAGLIGYGSYAPTKFAVTGLAECLRMEAADRGLGLTVVFPPDTDTPQLRAENESALPESLALKQSARVMSADAVARKFVEGMIHYRFEVLCNFESWYIRWIKATWPGVYYKIIDDIVARDRRRRGVTRVGTDR